MKIHIADHRTVSDIRHEFNHVFPFLKIEFFSRIHMDFGPSPKKYLKSGDDLKLAELRSMHSEGMLDIDPNITVSQLENSFRGLYGLNVQVFRKSGNVWLETTVTDNWTLEEQNREGESMEMDFGKRSGREEWM